MRSQACFDNWFYDTLKLQSTLKMFHIIEFLGQSLQKLFLFKWSTRKQWAIFEFKTQKDGSSSWTTCIPLNLPSHRLSLKKVSIHFHLRQKPIQCFTQVKTSIDKVHNHRGDTNQLLPCSPASRTSSVKQRKLNINHGQDHRAVLNQTILTAGAILPLDITFIVCFFLTLTFSFYLWLTVIPRFVANLEQFFSVNLG